MSAPTSLAAVGIGVGAGLLWAPVASGLVETWPAPQAVSASTLRHWVDGIRSRTMVRAVTVGCISAGASAVLLGGRSVGGLAVMLMALALVPLVAIDLDRQLIPDVVVLPASVGAMALGAIAQPTQWWLPVTWGLGAGGAIAVMWLISPSGIGLGDAKLAVLLGAALEGGVVVALAVAFALGGLAGIWLLIRRGPSARTLALPLGPFLAAGAVLVLLGGGWLAWA